jgi:hypothetical protein
MILNTYTDDKKANEIRKDIYTENGENTDEAVILVVSVAEFNLGQVHV